MGQNVVSRVVCGKVQGTTLREFYIFPKATPATPFVKKIALETKQE